jgi:hypothetical protein
VYVLGLQERTLGFLNVILAVGQEAAQKGKLTKQTKFIIRFSTSQHCIGFDIDERNW